MKKIIIALSLILNTGCVALNAHQARNDWIVQCIDNGATEARCEEIAGSSQEWREKEMDKFRRASGGQYCYDVSLDIVYEGPCVTSAVPPVTSYWP